MAWHAASVAGKFRRSGSLLSPRVVVVGCGATCGRFLPLKTKHHRNRSLASTKSIQAMNYKVLFKKKGCVQINEKHHGTTANVFAPSLCPALHPLFSARIISSWRDAPVSGLCLLLDPEGKTKRPGAHSKITHPT